MSLLDLRSLEEGVQQVDAVIEISPSASEPQATSNVVNNISSLVEVDASSTFDGNFSTPVVEVVAPELPTHGGGSTQDIRFPQKPPRVKPRPITSTVTIEARSSFKLKGRSDEVEPVEFELPEPQIEPLIQLSKLKPVNQPVAVSCSVSLVSRSHVELELLVDRSHRNQLEEEDNLLLLDVA